MQPLFFEDVKVGMTFRSAMSEPITLEMCEAHERITMDRVHRPENIPGQSEDDPIVVQGNLITALTGGLLFEVGHFKRTLKAQKEKHIIYARPTFVGNRIYATEEVVEVKDQPGKPTGIVILKRQTFNERGVLVQDVPYQDYRVAKRS